MPGRHARRPPVETYLDDVVVPWIDAHYRTAADWQHRVIGAITALEPYDDPGSAGRMMLRTRAQYDAGAPGATCGR